MRKNILIISIQGLGNTVMFEPTLRYLLKGKNINISVVMSNNGSYQFAKYLHGGAVNYYIWDEAENTVCNIINLVRKWRKKKFDIGYATYPSAKRENIFTQSRSV